MPGKTFVFPGISYIDNGEVGIVMSLTKTLQFARFDKLTFRAEAIIRDETIFVWASKNTS